jgi:hypothetical protein
MLPEIQSITIAPGIRTTFTKCEDEPIFSPGIDTVLRTDGKAGELSGGSQLVCGHVEFQPAGPSGSFKPESIANEHNRI